MGRALEPKLLAMRQQERVLGPPRAEGPVSALLPLASSPPELEHLMAAQQGYRVHQVQPSSLVAS
jgi:hypothetical protein